MSSELHAVLVADEGPGIGLGHRRRCEYLAGALRRAGIPAEVRAEADGRVDAPVVVVDSYRTRADDRTRYRGGVVVAVEDLGRDLDVDLLVVPAPGAESHGFHSARRVLAGASYVLVDPALATGTRRDPHDTPPAAPVVLVTTGAADERGVGAGIAAALATADATAEVCLVVGPWGCAGVPDGVVALHRPDGLADELARADVVVTAGGITMLEALALGCPAVVVETAENQRHQIAGVADAGAAWVTSVGDAPRRTRSLLADPAARARLSQRARMLIDAQGPERVAEVIARLARTGVMEAATRG